MPTVPSTTPRSSTCASPSLGLPFVLLALGAQGVQRGASDYRTPLVILLAANVVNLVLELAFVFGLDLGVAGTAWSTVIAQVCAGLAFVVVIRGRLALTRHRRPSWNGMRPLLTAGRYLLLRVGSMLAVFTGATALAARVDEPTLAAHQIAASMFAFLALALDALAIPAQTLVAEELGPGPTATRPTWRTGSCGCRLVRRPVARRSCWPCSPVLPHAFTDDAAVISRATRRCSGWP